MIAPSFSLTATERVLPRMALDFTTASLDARVTFTRSGNTATVTNSSGFVVANTAYKLSGAWNTNSCAAAKDGGTVGTDNTATIPTPTQLRLGSDGTNYASAIIQKVLYYPQRIINAEVQAISK